MRYPNLTEDGRILATRGVAAFLEENKCYWIFDCIKSYQAVSEVAEEEFLTIELTVEDSKGHIVVTDGNENTLHTQDIPYTDFPRPSVKFFQRGGIVMFPDEY